MTFFTGPAHWSREHQTDFDRAALTGEYDADELAGHFDRLDREAEKWPVHIEQPSERERDCTTELWTVDPETGCWNWNKAPNSTGYGVHWIIDDGGRKACGAHRWVYEHFVGPVSEGLHLDHLCRNRACVNPAHLEPVTCRENILRGIGPSAQNAQKTECVNGHPLSGENLHVRRTGERECKTCKRAWRARNEPKTVWPMICERCGDILPAGRHRFCSRRCQRRALHGGICIDCGAETYGQPGKRGTASRCATCNRRHLADAKKAAAHAAREIKAA